MSNLSVHASRLRRAALLLGCAVAFALGANAHAASPAEYPETALDRYVKKPDPSYAYSLVKQIDADAFTTYILSMTSQTWRKAEEVDRNVWQHDLVIVCPKEVKTHTALFYIDGGSNNGKVPEGASPMLAQIALSTNGVVFNLRHVPNEPLTFTEDGQKRTEDGIIAFTWKKFMETGDEEWPLRLPMTKAAVRAMDTVQDFLKKPDGGAIEIKDFVVCGGSKRGWTTWTTAAVDKRVKAIAPAVIDVLNVVPSFKHHYATYGFWAPAVDDYVKEGIMDWMGSKEYEALLKIEDPYSYRERLTMPKVMLNASGDQFFLPDSSQFYFDRLSGPKYLRYVPNADHGLDDTDAPSTLLSFYAAAAYDKPLPRFTWDFPTKGKFRVSCDDKPIEVKLWQATNPDARDFRVETLGKVWTETKLEPGDNGLYTAELSKPEKGWTAGFIELTFPGPFDVPHKFTTPVRVVPDVTPHRYELPAEKKKGFLSKDK